MSISMLISYLMNVKINYLHLHLVIIDVKNRNLFFSSAYAINIGSDMPLQHLD